MNSRKHARLRRQQLIRRFLKTVRRRVQAALEEAIRIEPIPYAEAGHVRVRIIVGEQIHRACDEARLVEDLRKIGIP